MSRGSEGPSRRVVFVLCLLAGVSLFALLGMNPCQRTQEARVLNTAREMYQWGGERWLMPTCNGVLRLRKPPLSYWATATSFAATGEVSEWSGRLPSAVCAGVMLGLVYVAGARLFSRRTGVLAAGLLLTTFLFYRFGRLAETDCMAAMFVSLAIWLFWRFLDDARFRASLALAGGIAVGAAFLAKGAPGAFAFAFLLMMGCLQRKWSKLAFGLPIALVAACMVGAPWYVYIWAKGHWHILQTEIDVVSSGEDHGRPAWYVLLHTVQATLPWTPLWLAALGVILVRRRASMLLFRRPLRAINGSLSYLRRTPALQMLFCWTLAILLPLLVPRNKQLHYVLPALPPLMLLAGWLLDSAMDGRLDRRICDVLRRLTFGLLTSFALAGMGILAWGILGAPNPWSLGRGIAVPVMALGAILAIGGAISFIAQWRRGMWAGTLGAIVTCAVAAPVLTPWLGPSFSDGDIRDTAAAVSAHAGRGRMVYWRSEPSLPLTFQLRRAVGKLRDPATLAKMADDPEVTVLIHAGSAEGPIEMPAPWRLAWEGGSKGHYTLVYRPKREPTPAAAAR